MYVCRVQIYFHSSYRRLKPRTFAVFLNVCPVKHLEEMFSFVGNEQRSWKTTSSFPPLYNVILCSSSKSSMFPDATSSGIERGWIFYVCGLWNERSYFASKIFSIHHNKFLEIKQSYLLTRLWIRRIFPMCDDMYSGRNLPRCLPHPSPTFPRLHI